MKKTVMSFLAAGLLAFSSGCATSPSQSRIETDYYNRLQINMGAAHLKLPENLQRTYVHEEEGGPSCGSATTDLKLGYDINLTLSPGVSIGTENIKLDASAGVGVAFLGINAGHGGGWSDLARQRGGSGSESYAFTQVYPDILNYRPTLGIETVLKKGDKNTIHSKDVFLRLEKSWIFNEFHYKKGHDRWGGWETTDRDSWKGVGHGYGLVLGKRDKTDKDSAALRLNYERYDPEFLGEKTRIDLFTIGIEFFAGHY